MSGEGISRAAKTTIRMERWRNMKKVNALYRERQNKATKPKATSSVSTTKTNNKKRSPATVWAVQSAVRADSASDWRQVWTSVNKAWLLVLILNHGLEAPTKNWRELSFARSGCLRMDFDSRGRWQALLSVSWVSGHYSVASPKYDLNRLNGKRWCLPGKQSITSNMPWHMTKQYNTVCSNVWHWIHKLSLHKITHIKHTFRNSFRQTYSSCCNKSAVNRAELT